MNVKKARAERRAIEERNAEIQRMLQELFAKLKEEACKNSEAEEECKKSVIFLLYKLHHLLRTHQSEGIYSLHGTTYLPFNKVIFYVARELLVLFFRQLSALEVLMKALPFTDYMKELRKVYNRECKKTERQYVFTSKKLQKMEDLYRLKNKDVDIKEEGKSLPKRAYSKQYIKEKQNITRNAPFKFCFRFILTKKVDRRCYERMVTTQGVYPNPKFILRETNSALNLSKTSLPKVTSYLPYYIDFWTKSCPLHNPPSCLD